MDTSFKSTANPPQSITGKTELATWSYTSLAVITPATLILATTSGKLNPSGFTKTPGGREHLD